MAESRLNLNNIVEFDGQITEVRNAVHDTHNNHSLNINSEVEFGYYEELMGSRDVRDFKQRISDIVNRMGFSDYSFTRLAVAGVDPNILITCPDKLLKTYLEKNFHVHDMTVSYVERNKSPTYLSTLYDYVEQAPFVTSMTRTMRDIYHLYKSFGYYDCYIVPAEARNVLGKVVFTVALRGCGPFELKRKVDACASSLQLLCEAIDYVAIDKFSDVFLKLALGRRTIEINPKPLSVLETLANNDLNIAQVADQLCISVVTANKHLETARKAFGTRTNYAAIRRAVLNGLIEYRE